MIEWFRHLGASLSRFTERWVPDSWVICMFLTAAALLLAVAGAGVGVEAAVLAWGTGMWTLLELAMQFAIAMVASHACVSSRPVYRLLDRIARIPDPERPLQAVLLAGLFSLVTGYLNWAFCIVGGALFIPFLCRHNPKADVRILIVGAYLGMGTVWHCGLSASAPLIMATPGNPLLEPAAGQPVVDRLLPVTQTLFNPFNLIYMFGIATVGLATLLLLHPRRGRVTLTRERVEAILPQPPRLPERTSTPAGTLEHFRGWVVLAVVLILYPLGHTLVTRGFGTAWTINGYNMLFLGAALLLHGRPDSFVRACRKGAGATWGIILQFPFYAGIFGVMNNTTLGAWLGELFARLASADTYPIVIYVYSGFMNLFVPSGGSKWMIEAPFLIPAGEELGVSVTTILLSYSYGDTTTNLIQPFWAIPILSLTRMRFGDVVGYSSLVGLACFFFSLIAMLLIPIRL